MHRMTIHRHFLYLCCYLLTEAAVHQARAAATIRFNRDIRPILSDNCFQCHGPDGGDRKAALRLDLWSEDLEKDGIVVRGKGSESELWKRITTHDQDDRMPPEESGKSVSSVEAELLKQWIDEGAHYEGHWAYIAPVRPEIPSVKDTSWPINPIDFFILSRLEQAGLKPSPEADKATLARRASFDLTGLPPSKAILSSFLKDASPEAFGNLVSQLINQPAYGERMAIQWLDLVRFADTVGYHGDQPYSVWPFRDYVIEAFNENLPFDEFTREQLAGDLLPDPTRRQLIASGYNRLNMITAEGGAQDKEYLAKYAADRVRTTSTTWLGATMGCSECHDHKFDPYTMKDFYSMEAFFADLDEKGFYGGANRDGRWGPMIQLKSEEDLAKLKEFEDKIAALKHELNNSSESIQKAQEDWEEHLRKLDSTHQLKWVPIRPTKVSSEPEMPIRVQRLGGILPATNRMENANFTVTLESHRKEITGLMLEVLPNGEKDKKRMGLGSGNFILTAFEVHRVDEKGKRIGKVKLAKAVADYSQKGFEIANSIDGKKDTGWAVDGHKKIERRTAAFTFKDPLRATDSPIRLEVVLKHESKQKNHVIGRFRISESSVPDPTIDKSGIPPEHLATIRGETSEQKSSDSLSAYFRSITPLLDPVRKDLASTEAAMKRYDEGIPTMLVSRKREEPRVIRILPRGNWLDDSGAIVQPYPPEFLGGDLRKDTRLNRLDFANWLVSRDNPLTARVFVNRLWKSYHGTGLSKVLDDLGSQGEWPEHAALLDWLAVEFMESGWDIKHIIKLMTSSATYRQSSRFREDLAAADPFNRLHGRQSAFRMEAEVIRDNALAVSDLLVRKIGGPSAKPYQPDGYYEQLNFPKRTYQPDKGTEQYRRGVYTHWQRTFLHPTMKAFDAPSREECTAERPNSNTPLQALALLNDPSFVEAARAFAEKLVSSQAPERRIEEAYRMALSRTPKPEERKVIEELLKLPVSDEDAAILKVGNLHEPSAQQEEILRWTRVARALFNTHEFITRY